jgi:hypothetical protein
MLGSPCKWITKQKFQWGDFHRNWVHSELLSSFLFLCLTLSVSTTFCIYFYFCLYRLKHCKFQVQFKKLSKFYIKASTERIFFLWYNTLEQALLYGALKFGSDMLRRYSFFSFCHQTLKRKIFLKSWKAQAP